jgi:hypothetical protein
MAVWARFVDEHPPEGEWTVLAVAPPAHVCRI